MANASICRKFDSSKRWVDVPRFEGIYAVSDVGDVMRVSPGAGRAKVGAILSFARNPKGYKHVGLCKNGKSETTYIHVLVCGAFHGPKPTPTHQAAHRNDDKETIQRQTFIGQRLLRITATDAETAVFCKDRRSARQLSKKKMC